METFEWQSLIDDAVLQQVPSLAPC